MLDESRRPPAWLKASGYWVRGLAGAHASVKGDVPSRRLRTSGWALDQSRRECAPIADLEVSSASTPSVEGELERGIIVRLEACVVKAQGSKRGMAKLLAPRNRRTDPVCSPPTIEVRAAFA